MTSYFAKQDFFKLKLTALMLFILASCIIESKVLLLTVLQKLRALFCQNLTQHCDFVPMKL